jgi:hypothetical protein
VVLAAPREPERSAGPSVQEVTGMQIVTWLVAAMFAWTPAKEADRARYTEIANDIAAVVYDPQEQPLAPAATEGRRGVSCNSTSDRAKRSKDGPART